MSDIQTAIFQELKKDASIFAMVESNIYPLSLPEAVLKDVSVSPRNFIVYERISSPKKTDIDIELPLFQITVMSDIYSNVLTLRAHVIRVLERFKGYLGVPGKNRDVKRIHLEGEAEMRNPETEFFYVHLSFRFKYFGDNV